MPALLSSDLTQAPTAPPTGQPWRTAWILHGILGSRQNWRAFSRRLARVLPGWQLRTVDHRNHGDSPLLPGPHSVRSCALDLQDLAVGLGEQPEVLIGHSFGGKVALAHAALRPPGLAQVWVLDAMPGPVCDRGDNEVDRVIAALGEIPQPLPRRDAVVPLLEARGFSSTLARWMTTNLEEAPGGYTWRFNLPAVREMIDDYFNLDLWPVLEAPRVGPQIHVVRAARSDRWDAPTLDRLAHPPAGAPTSLHLLPDAGHWVHVDNPAGLIAMMAGSWVP